MGNAGEKIPIEKVKRYVIFSLEYIIFVFVVLILLAKGYQFTSKFGWVVSYLFALVMIGLVAFLYALLIYVPKGENNYG